MIKEHCKKYSVLIAILIAVSLAFTAILPCNTYSAEKIEVEETENVKIHGDETKAPVITDVRIVTNEVTRPGIATIEVDVLGEDIGITYVEIVISQIEYANENSGKPNTYLYDVWEGKSVYKGTVTVDIPMDSNAMLGEWRIYNMYVRDSIGNSTSYSSYGHADEPDRGYYFTHLNGTERFELPTFTLKDEFDYDQRISLSHPDLVSRIESMSEGKTIRLFIDDDSNGILPKAAFDAIKGKDKRIVAYKDSYQWIFYGKDVVNETKDVNLIADISTVDDREYNTDENAVKIEFFPNGELPCETEIRYKSDYLYDLHGVLGRLYLYYIKNGIPMLEDNPKFDLKFDGTDKWCNFHIDHNSTFLITGSTASQSVPEKGSMSSQPIPEKGSVLKDASKTANYKVTSSKADKVEVEYKSPVNKKKTSVTIPATVKLADGTVAEVTAIAGKAFKNNKYVKKIIVSKNVEKIGKEAFSGCTKLTTVTLGAKVEDIGSKGFYGCKKLTKVSMGKNVENIGSSAFAKCTALKSLTLPADVEKIGTKAFYGDKKLKKITIKSKKLKSSKVGKQAFKGIYSKAKVDVPNKKVKAYKKFFYKRGLSKKAKIS